MKIFVQTSAGKTIALDVEATDTIGNVRDKTHDTYGISYDQPSWNVSRSDEVGDLLDEWIHADVSDQDDTVDEEGTDVEEHLDAKGNKVFIQVGGA